MRDWNQIQAVAFTLGADPMQVRDVSQADTETLNKWGKPPICRACGQSADGRVFVVAWNTQEPEVGQCYKPLQRHRRVDFCCEKCVGGVAK